MTDPKEVADLVARLREHCVGHPHAKIEWPHRILHEAATALETLTAEKDKWKALALKKEAFILSKADEIETTASELERVKGERDAFSESYTATYELMVSLTDKLTAAEASLGLAETALKNLLALNDTHSPFGGEIYRDRVDRAWDAARSALASIQAKGE